MEMVNLKLALAVLVGVGFVGAIIARRVGVPMITGYLVIGMILSPSVTPLLSKALLTDMTDIITPLALGIIAYLIGGSLYLPNIARYGRVIAIITLFQGIGPWIGVALLITFVGPLFITTGVWGRRLEELLNHGHRWGSNLPGHSSRRDPGRYPRVPRQGAPNHHSA